MTEPAEMLAQEMRDMSSSDRKIFEDEFDGFCRRYSLVAYENFDRYEWAKLAFWIGKKSAQ